MAAVLLTRQSIKKVSNDLKRQVQVYKVDASKATISSLQSQDRFPPDKLITSYVTSTNARNKYEDINRFWTKMEVAPKFWLKRFIHVPEIVGGDLNKRIAMAAAEAKQIADRQYQSYPRIQSTGHLINSVVTEVNGVQTFNTTQEINDSPGTAYFKMWNKAEYASTAEARAVYVTQQRGLIFYAANRIQTRYPDLGVRYYYMDQSEHKQAFIYDVPALIISSKENTRGNWHRPGYQIRDRRRTARREANLFKRFRERNIG